MFKLLEFNSVVSIIAGLSVFCNFIQFLEVGKTTYNLSPPSTCICAPPPPCTASHFSQHENSQTVPFLPPSSTSEDAPIDKMTVVVQTYGQYRPERNLSFVIAIYGQFPDLVHEIVIVWNSPHSNEETLLAELKEYNMQVPVRLRFEKENSINNRFRPDPKFETDAIFIADDDNMMRHPRNIFHYWDVWRQHQDRIVGSVWAYTDLDENGTLWYRARKIDWPCPKRPVNFVLTIGMLLHKKYLDAYWSEANGFIRDQVQNLTTCEDISMNFVVTKILRDEDKINKDWGTNLCLPIPWEHIKMERQGRPLSWTTAKYRTDCLRNLADWHGFETTGTNREMFCENPGRSTCWNNPEEDDPDSPTIEANLVQSPFRVF